MSEEVQAEPNEPVTADSSSLSALPTSLEQKFVTGAERLPDEELYGFRAALAEPAEEEAPEQKIARGSPLLFVALLMVAMAVAGLLAIGGAALFKSKTPPNLYVDLGTKRYDPAGVGGRLIAQWTGSGAYKFTIDPLDPAQIPGFQATLANPPHAITFKLLLKDAADRVACEKDIVIPGVPQGTEAFDKTQAMAPRSIPTGGTIQNVAGSNGQIGEAVLTGPLPCDLEAYKKIVGWDFSTDFPPLITQKDWKKHEDDVQAKADRAKSGASRSPQSIGGYLFVKSLPSPIEADDVIVGDNPSKGIVSTGSGRSFLVGRSVLVNPALDWQVFPAEIHYRCDKSGMCVLTRLDSRSAVHAHLMK